MIELTSRAPIQEYLDGQLLVAMPNLKEGCFEQSVVLICSHDESHAMGLILNKKITDVSFGELLLQLEMRPGPAALEQHVFFGGPVETKRGIVLHSSDYETSDTAQVVEGVCLTATKKILEDLNAGPDDPDARRPDKALLCMGHAGWAPSQLEGELAQNAWLNLPATPELVFATDPEKTWERALESLGVTSSMFSAEWSDLRNPDAPLN